MARAARAARAVPLGMSTSEDLIAWLPMIAYAVSISNGVLTL